jgi:hypothetical protein
MRGVGLAGDWKMGVELLKENGGGRGILQGQKPLRPGFEAGRSGF